MSGIDQTRSLVVISKDGTDSTISSTDIVVNRLLTEGFDTAVGLWDYPDNAGSVPALDSTINIYMRKGTIDVDNQVFSGKISAIRKQSRGLEHRWLELDCWGWGKYLTDRIWKGKIKDLGHNCINTVVAELVNEGLLYTGGVSVSAESIVVDASNGKVMMDILRDDICNGEENKLDWDFYVDFGKTLNAFQRGIRETGLNIASLSLSFDYEESIENCINVQTVWGTSKVIMNDASLTDNSPGWTSNANLYNNTAIKTAGNYSLFAELPNGANPIWLKQTYPTALDLSEGGILRFDYRYWVRMGWEAVEPKITITVYLMSDDSNYVHLTFEEGGAYNERRDIMASGELIHVPWGYCVIKYDWHPTEISFNKLADKEWGYVGNINWSAVTAMSIDIDGPLSVIDHPNKFYIDNATIETSYYGKYSVATDYDVRVGKPKKTKLESDEGCLYLGSLIVEAYKDPQLKIENLELSKNFEVDIGDNVIFNTLDINCTLTVRSIEHKLQDFDLKTRVELSPRYIPSPERMTALFQRQLEDLNFNLEAYRLVTASKGIIPGRGLIDWWEIDSPMFSILSWTGIKMLVAQGQSSDGWGWNQGQEGTWNTGFGYWELSTGTVGTTITAGGAYVCPVDDNTVVLKTVRHDRSIGFGCQFELTNTVDSSAFMTVGRYPTATEPGFGFYALNGTLYGHCRDTVGPSANTPIETLSINQRYMVQAAYYPGNKIDFFVDNDYKGSLTTKLPDSDMTPMLLAVFTTISANDTTLKVYNAQVGEA